MLQACCLVLGVPLLLEQMLSAPKASITSGGRSVVIEASDATAWTFKCRWPFLGVVLVPCIDLRGFCLG